jgi:hypothetical protein
MHPEDIHLARSYIQSILTGLRKMENGSTVEQAYLTEKIDKLFSLHHLNFHAYHESVKDLIKKELIKE